MSDFRVVEQTASGWKQIVGAQVSYQDSSGQFVSREEYVAEREATSTADGYGSGGYGQ